MSTYTVSYKMNNTRRKAALSRDAFRELGLKAANSDLYFYLVKCGDVELTREANARVYRVRAKAEIDSLRGSAGHQADLARLVSGEALSFPAEEARDFHSWLVRAMTRCAGKKPKPASRALTAYHVKAACAFHHRGGTYLRVPFGRGRVLEGTRERGVVTFRVKAGSIY